MSKERTSDSGRRVLPGNRIVAGLIAGVIVLGIVLACLAGWGLYSVAGRGSSDTALSNRASWDVPEAPPPAPVEVEKVVQIEAASSPSVGSGYEVPGLAYAAEHLIIRTGNIALVVRDTRAALGAIEEMVRGMAGEGAFVVSSDEYGGTENSQPYISVSIRIPAARFDETMDRLADLAVNVTSRNESAQDVTEEYVDLEARLESLEAARQRLLQIMQEARLTKDVLEAEQQLTQREAEIESIKGRMQYLEQSAQLSSIWIELQPYILSQPVGKEWRPVETARRAVEALVDGLRGFADFAIFFTIAVLPWLVAIALVILVVVRLIRWRVRARRARRAAAGETPGTPSDTETD